MENVFDVKYKQQLEYILPDGVEQDIDSHTISFRDDTVVIMYFYYIDTLSDYWKYIDNIQKFVTVFAITPLEEIEKKVSDKVTQRQWSNVEIIRKPNRGRDITGLLIAAKPVISKYKYICFIHDKKAHFKETEEDVALWVENMWENLIGNAGHIQKILGIFEGNNKLGVLVPPAPVGKVFKVWYGFGWRNCFNTVKELASKLGLNCDLDEAKPPITIGTTFWFRREALQKLFDYPWKYEDFDDIKLEDNQYLSFAVERIFAYIAQDAGYTTGEVMTVEYAKKQTLFLQYSLPEIFRKMHDFYPFPTYENALHIDDNLQHLQQYALNKDEIFLFGTDDVGKFCAGYLRKIGHEPKGFIVSEIIDNDAIDYIPVFSIEECSQCGSNKGIIITATTRKAQNEMVNELEKYQIEDYCIFLQEAR